MSDILIRGMEMPEHCGECKLKAEYDDEMFCPFFADNVEYWIAAGRRHEDCPLGYIPTHGDLIDRNVLYHNMFIGPDEKLFPDRDVDNFPHEMRFEDIKRFIRKAQTVIQASE